MKVLVAVIFSVILGFSQVPVKNVDGNGNEIILGASGRTYNSGMTTVTTVSTSLTTSTIKVQTIHCGNSSGSATTLTIKDGSDVTFFPSVNMPANSIMVANYGTVGMVFDGIKLSASANSSITCKIIGVQ